MPEIKLWRGREVTITPTSSGSFVNGVWTGTVAVQEEAEDVCLRAADGSGHKGVSNSFDVTPVSYDWNTISSPQT